MSYDPGPSLMMSAFGFLMVLVFGTIGYYSFGRTPFMLALLPWVMALVMAVVGGFFFLQATRII